MKHLDRSHKYFDMFQARDEKLKKQVRLYEIEANNYKHCSSKDSNKNQGVCRRSLVIFFHCKSTKIGKIKIGKISVELISTFQKKNYYENFQQKLVCTFEQQRIYFDNGIISIAMGHPLLSKLKQCKKDDKKWNS